MKHLTLILILLCGCTEPERGHVYETVEHAFIPIAAAQTSPTQLDVLKYICTNDAMNDRWATSITLEADLYPDEPIECSKRVIINGNGFTIHQYGIHFLPGASWSVVRDMRFKGFGSGVGLDIESHGIRLSNLWVDNWEHGIRAYSTGPNSGNANGQSWHDLVVRNCATGILLDGGDANAGLLTNVESTNNGIHIHDSSFLGNTHVAGISDGNGIYRVHDSPAAYSTLVGTYAEGEPVADERIDLVGYNTVLGGSVSLWSSQDSQTTISPHGWSKAAFGSKSGRVRVSIPGGPDSLFAFSHSDEQYTWKGFKYMAGWKMWTLSAYLGSGYHVPFRWHGDQSPYYTGQGEVIQW